MNRDKQIEEMAKDVTRSICWCNEEIPTVDGMGTAITLYNKGYRKSTDLAEEIFAEIEKLRPITKLVIKDLGEWDFDKDGEKFYWLSETKIAELKKKYTEEGK